MKYLTVVKSGTECTQAVPYPAANPTPLRASSFLAAIVPPLCVFGLLFGWTVGMCAFKKLWGWRGTGTPAVFIISLTRIQCWASTCYSKALHKWSLRKVEPSRFVYWYNKLMNNGINKNGGKLHFTRVTLIIIINVNMQIAPHPLTDDTTMCKLEKCVRI